MPKDPAEQAAEEAKARIAKAHQLAEETLKQFAAMPKTQQDEIKRKASRKLKGWIEIDPHPTPQKTPEEAKAFFANLRAKSDRAEARRRAAQPPGFQRGTGTPEPRVVLGPRHEDLNNLPVGKSRFGGLPDLPPELAWPTFEGRKIPFLAQLELSRLVRSNVDSLLSDGWLFAFGLFESGHHAVVFHHYQGSGKALVRAKAPKKNELWQDWAGRPLLYDVVGLAPKKTPGNEAGWLFGEVDPDEAGDTAGDIADQQNRSGDDWINLLAIRSIGSMRWSDGGTLYFVLRRKDLAAGNFSNICAAILGAA